MSLFSIGHSNRSLEAFTALLTQAAIFVLVDVRLRPASHQFPHFSRPALVETLGHMDIEYRWLGKALGGMRPTDPRSPHLSLEPAGLHGYADHTSTSTFQGVMRQVTELAQERSAVLMCAERHPMRCHRSLIADWLFLREIPVTNIGVGARPQVHRLRPEARVAGTQLKYDRGTQGQLL